MNGKQKVESGTGMHFSHNLCIVDVGVHFPCTKRTRMGRRQIGTSLHDDLVIASFVSGPGSTTLPMLIFSKVKLGVSPAINALATLIIVAISLGVVIAWLVTRRRASKP